MYIMFFSGLKERLEAKFDEQTTWRYFRQIVEGLKHIHSKRIIHRDLSSNNIFFDDSDNVKIGDFGLVQQSGSPVGVFEGTIFYRAPESATENSSKLDIYSVGILLFEMLCQFNTGSERSHVIKKLTTEKILPDDWQYADEYTDFLFELIADDPNQRPSASDILQNDLLLRNT
ncbi:probable serine/threonine-protein kinase ifkC [Tripterygium wilfordii]|uniref:probable serine/threonine-protein kinase ifkC n=1 Tax=Tripterygium wilfordii TaxID=458696 RepID=UPI0018F7F84C|nr:probable serine/threonine-protein kinase ifkC [Tripterygium wilfordii]